MQDSRPLAATSTGQPGPDPLTRPAHLCVLLVGGAEVVSAVSSTVLGREDIDRFTTGDAERALAEARTRRPAMVVVDAGRLPAIDFVRQLRSDPNTRPTAIVVVVPSIDPGQAEELLAAGANLVCPTPMEPALWDVRLNELLSVPPRRAARLPVRLRVWSRSAPAAEPVEGVALNISVRGLLLESGVHLEVGAKLDLAFHLPDRGPERLVVAQVVRDAGSEESRWRSGIEFLVVRGDAREAITRFVEESSAARGQHDAVAEVGESLEWETELRASEARVAAILDSALDAIVVMDQQGRITEWNPAAELMFGYRRSDVIGRTVADTVVPARLRERHRQGFARLLATGESQLLNRRVEMPACRDDGTEIPVELAITTTVVKGRPSFTAYLRDISERRRAEEALRASEERFRALVEQSSDAIGLLDAPGHFVYLSGSATRILGYAPEELLNRDAFDLVHPDDTTGTRAAFARCLESPGLPVTAECRYKHQDGSWRHIEGVAVNRLGDPAIAAVVVNFRDITERKQAEASVDASERRFHALFDAALEAILVLDDEGRCVEANSAACALFGRARTDVLGHWIGDFVAAGSEFEALWLRLREERRTEGELRFLRPDGKARVVEFAATADFLPGSHLAVLRDTTERRELEEQLRQSQRIEAVGRLAGGVAHDFNNLLAVILGYAEMGLGRADDPAAVGRDLEQIRRASQRAASLTRQLLAFSRKQVLVPKVLDLGSVVGELETMLRRLIGEDVELVTTVGPGIGRVKADPGQVEQVILNLAVNARDAMPGGGRLNISVEDTTLDDAFVREHLGSAAGLHVALRVQDTGVGMDEATRSRAFEPFFTTKEKGKGTGLGLSTVYGIVKQSGGYITVESQPGHGASFVVYLPRVEEPQQPAQVPPPALQARGEETILLVEDDAAVRALTREVLESYGYTVLEAANGPEALRLSDRHPAVIPLLLTDVVMPGMSGPALAAELALRRPNTRVLYASGYTDDAVAQAGVLEPGIHLIQKPYSPEALARRVREVLDR